MKKDRYLHYFYIYKSRIQVYGYLSVQIAILEYSCVYAIIALRV